jgi:two-component system NtrC family sensor kinase
VIDDGPGIPADALPHVFEPFFTTKTVGTGTGLGLSVSYGIVEEHGGHLGVESHPGRTVFRLELPVAQSPAARRVAPAGSPMIVTGEGRTALVVEDEASVLDLIVTILSQTGWRVDVATGGREGLERVRRQSYDLIVSDIRMPDGDGEEFYRDATQGDPSLTQRFIFITGDTANREAFKFLREAGVLVVEKPFQPAFFLDAVRRVTT